LSNSSEIRYGIQELYLFPYFQTREDYKKAVGVEPPPFNSNRAPKYWFDPAAKDYSRRSMVYGQSLVYYSNGSPMADAKGNPVLDVLVINRDEAASVNIPAKHVGAANIAGADAPEVPMPLRPLEPNEELFFPFPGIVAVRIKGTQEADRGFTEEDRAILLAIAKKLGV
jgi:hypothetical protein